MVPRVERRIVTLGCRSAVAATDRARRPAGSAWTWRSTRLSAIFAAITAVASTLPPHRAWGAVAAAGYAAAAVLASGSGRPVARLGNGGPGCAVLTFGTHDPACPWLVLVAARAQGRTDRAQEEVMVIEDGARRLLETGSPYLSREAIAALPPGDQLLGYLPYQPGMAVFGLPRADVRSGWRDRCPGVVRRGHHRCRWRAPC